jgi:hypothetical protein
MGTGTTGGNQNTARANLGRATPPAKIILADGNEYTITPLNLNSLCSLEERFGKEADELLKKPTMKVVRALLFECIKPNHPGLTEEMVGELVTGEIISKLGELLKVA